MVYKTADKKSVSARDMNLSIGQNAGYINNIENGKALPSMMGFFFNCEFDKKRIEKSRQKSVIMRITTDLENRKAVFYMEQIAIFLRYRRFLQRL